ncbi:MAG: hypothetical protein ACYTGF_14190 [Planctomycetota bacterium]
MVDAFKMNKWLQHGTCGEAVVGSVSEPPAEQEHEQMQEQEAA